MSYSLLETWFSFYQCYTYSHTFASNFLNCDWMLAFCQCSSCLWEKNRSHKNSRCIFRAIYALTIILLLGIVAYMLKSLNDALERHIALIYIIYTTVISSLKLTLYKVIIPLPKLLLTYWKDNDTLFPGGWNYVLCMQVNYCLSTTHATPKYTWKI